jgi:hypothetical protein
MTCSQADSIDDTAHILLLQLTNSISTMAATTNGVTNGQPTNGDQSYSIPRSADQVFKEGILDNPKIKLPAGYREAAAGVKFEGSDMPTLPVNWRFAESISSLKALEAVFVNSLLQRKYGVKPAEVVINTYVYGPEHCGSDALSSKLR